MPARATTTTAALDGYARDLVRTYLSTLDGDRVAARAFPVEQDSLGAVARLRRRARCTRWPR